ncbi:MULTISPECIES: hypothetical protein [Clavibacter]|uniref:Integral membrane protein n=2 Tax=Clavibacter TaxID=1573 RepID=A0A399NWL7_9MICO|nr:MULTISPECIES: hypothetical protein [Clavibacter]KDP92563.1 hypothetical protein W824_00965 [Clavibacter cf. michiganensis LMG 26808]RII98118.1 hypothetical protein DZF96_04495 [Clavibacter michiganensis]UKF25246.1 hypothetical protein KYT88_00705 [Clavibacter sp. A6099]
MDDRRRFEDDSAARQRLTGELSARQVLVLIAVTAFMSASALAFVELESVTRIVLMIVVMLVLVLIGRVVMRRSNLRRNR